ncbi:methylated-DNA--[protein]-cysteine S-methyltransferase [soil metagenome]
MTRYRMIDSPLGPLTLAGRGPVLTHVRMVDQTYEPERADWTLDDRAFPDAVEQLAAYFSGELRQFQLKIEFEGTPFQRLVWEALRTIPYGETRTYGEMARQIGNPTASRAVGLANGHNPIAVIVPCHRVIGANGSLTGFGGGLHRKRALLDMEKSASSPSLFD